MCGLNDFLLFTYFSTERKRKPVRLLSIVRDLKKKQKRFIFFASTIFPYSESTVMISSLDCISLNIDLRHHWSKSIYYRTYSMFVSFSICQEKGAINLLSMCPCRVQFSLSCFPFHPSNTNNKSIALFCAV